MLENSQPVYLFDCNYGVRMMHSLIERVPLIILLFIVIHSHPPAHCSSSRSISFKGCKTAADHAASEGAQLVLFLQYLI